MFLCKEATKLVKKMRCVFLYFVCLFYNEIYYDTVYFSDLTTSIAMTKSFLYTS